MTPAEMMSMRRAGFTYKEISAKSGVPWGTVRTRLQRWGIHPEEKVIRRRRRPIVNDYPRWLIMEMYWECKLSTVDIGYELDISKHSVNTMMQRLKIPRRSVKEAWAIRSSRPGYTPPPPMTKERATEMAKLAVKKRERKARKKATKQRYLQRKKAEQCLSS